jgi:hypothetical protein
MTSTTLPALSPLPARAVESGGAAFSVIAPGGYEAGVADFYPGQFESAVTFVTHVAALGEDAPGLVPRNAAAVSVMAEALS